MLSEKSVELNLTAELLAWLSWITGVTHPGSEEWPKEERQRPMNRLTPGDRFDAHKALRRTACRPRARWRSVTGSARGPHARPETGSGPTQVCGNACHLPEGLHVDQQDDGRERGDSQLEYYPVVPEQSPRGAERKSDSAHKRRMRERNEHQPGCWGHHEVRATYRAFAR